jgi:hypothetical protein
MKTVRKTMNRSLDKTKGTRAGLATTPINEFLAPSPNNTVNVHGDLRHSTQFVKYFFAGNEEKIRMFQWSLELAFVLYNKALSTVRTWPQGAAANRPLLVSTNETFSLQSTFQSGIRQVG